MLGANQLCWAARRCGTRFSEVDIAAFRTLYDAIVGAGEALHPEVEFSVWKGGRAKQSVACNLLRRFRKHADAVLLFIRDPAVPFTNNTAYAARGISRVMPTPGLCRVHGRVDKTVGRISVPVHPICRHYQRPSRKASNVSGGLYRVGTRPLTLACASARSLRRMSACKYICVVSDDA